MSAVTDGRDVGGGSLEWVSGRAWIRGLRGLMMRPVPYYKDIVKNACGFRILSANDASKTKRTVGILSLPSEKQWQNAYRWEASYDRFASVRSTHWLSFFSELGPHPSWGSEFVCCHRFRGEGRRVVRVVGGGPLIMLLTF